MWHEQIGLLAYPVSISLPILPVSHKGGTVAFSDEDDFWNYSGGDRG